MNREAVVLQSHFWLHVISARTRWLIVADLESGMRRRCSPAYA